MPRVPQRASSAKKSKTITPNRRGAKKRAAGAARPPSPGKTPRPERSPAPSRIDRSTVRGTINRLLREAMERLEGATSAADGGTGPAAYARLVIAALLVMIERIEGARHESAERAAVAFADAVWRTSSRGPSGNSNGAGHVAGAGGGGGGDGSSSGAPPSAPPPSPPPRKDVRRPAAPHLRALGIEFHAVIDELDRASLADMSAFLFPGDDDPAIGILMNVERSLELVRHTFRSDLDPDHDSLDMTLFEMQSRVIVARELYRRALAAVAPAEKGGRS